MSDEKKLCQRCQRIPPIKGEKYCKRCRGAVLFDLKNAGYLQDTSETKRVSEQKDRTARDTRVIANDFGRDSDDEEKE